MQSTEKTSYSKSDALRSLEKENLTFWDVEILLGYVMSALGNAKEATSGTDESLHVFRQVSKSIEDDINFAIDKASSIASVMARLEEKIYSEMEASYDRIDSRVTAHINKINGLQKKINSVQLTLPEIQYPHNYKEAVELAERISRMDDRSLEVLSNLSKALKQ